MSSLPLEAVAASYAKAFAVREKSIRSRATFIAQYDDCRGELITWVNRLEVLLEKILEGRLSIQRQLSRLRSGGDTMRPMTLRRSCTSFCGPDS